MAITLSREISLDHPFSLRVVFHLMLELKNRTCEPKVIKLELLLQKQNYYDTLHNNRENLTTEWMESLCCC